MVKSGKKKKQALGEILYPVTIPFLKPHRPDQTSQVDLAILHRSNSKSNVFLNHKPKLPNVLLLM